MYELMLHETAREKGEKTRVRGISHDTNMSAMRIFELHIINDNSSLGNNKTILNGLNTINKVYVSSNAMKHN